MNAITVVKNGDKFIAKFKFSYETKDAVKAAGFRFNGADKEWFTQDPFIAAKLDGNIATLNPEMPKDGWPDPQLPVAAPEMPDGLELLPFQREGVAWLRGRPNALLADEMGLGKTVQIIGLMNTMEDVSRVLVICPASLKLNWRNELEKWYKHSFVVQVIMPGSAWAPADVTIINYEQVEKFRPEIDRIGWDLLVCDESHYLKNGKAARTKVVVGKWDADPKARIYPIKAKQRVFLTGTPILNRPKELWTTVRALDIKGLGADWMHYHTRYCAGYKDRHGWQLDGASNLEELNQRLRSGIMLRRKKADVLPELPPKRRQIIMLEPISIKAKQALKAEEALRETAEKIAGLRAEVERLSVDKADENYKKAVQKLEACEGVAFNETAKVRHNTALAKLPMAMDYLVNVFESEEKIVVFAHHHDVIDHLVDGLAEYGVMQIDGRFDTVRRQAAVDAFQNNPKVRVIIGSIGAMGSGWTLTAASYVGFVELDWVPGNLSQAEDRLHRIGQKESILVQHLMLDGSFDAHMAKVVMAKQKIIERATG